MIKTLLLLLAASGIVQSYYASYTTNSTRVGCPYDGCNGRDDDVYCKIKSCRRTICKKQLCDGEAQCPHPDWDDEDPTFCKNFACGDGKIACTLVTTGEDVCLHADRVCDHVQDCEDFSDEFPCTSPQFGRFYGPTERSYTYGQGTLIGLSIYDIESPDLCILQCEENSICDGFNYSYEKKRCTSFFHFWGANFTRALEFGDDYEPDAVGYAKLPKSSIKN